MGRIRFAIRSLAKSPLIGAVVVLSLGLGIGVNTAIFSLLHQVVLSQLPIPHPEQIVVLTSPAEFKNGRSSDNDSGGMDYIFNWRTLRELEKHAEAASVVGFRTFNGNIAFANQTVSGSMMLVSGNYFPVLGIHPIAGRLIGPEDDIPGNPVAMLSYRYWRDNLGGDPGVLNQTVRANGQPFTLVGILPPNFTGTTVGSEPGLFVPMSFKPRLTEGWNGTDRLDDYWVYLLARLKPGVTRPQAEASLNAVYRGIVDEMAATTKIPKGTETRFQQQKLSIADGSRGNSDFRAGLRPALMILLLATGLVLLIAMANAANLLLVRAAERKKELAIRAALGAGRRDLTIQLLIEALLLAGAGGLAGLAIALGSLKLLLAAWGGNGPDSFTSVGLNWPVLWFSLALSFVTGLLFGLYPAWSGSRVSLASTLSDESGKASSSRASSTLRKVLVSAQVTIAIFLLIPAGLFVKSLMNLLHVDLGMRTANVIGFRINPHSNGYAPAQSERIFERAEADLGAIPGVRSAVGALVPLIGDSNWGTSFDIEGQPTPGKRTNSRYNEVGPKFFSKAGIPLIAGREIQESDTAAAPKVAVVNQAFVKEFFGGRNPIGRRLIFGRHGNVSVEIVGVVKDSHYSSVRRPPQPLFFRPWRQDEIAGTMSFYVRTELAPDQIAPQIRRVMRAIDPGLPLEDMRTMDEQVRHNLRTDSLMMRLAAAFAALATVLAMLGLYGMMAHGVARRTREIGIRMALGAAPARIRVMVMRELAWILGCGLAVGIPAALAATKLVESKLYGVRGRDVTIVGAATLLLVLTAVASAYWPARRASLVDPMNALRWE